MRAIEHGRAALIAVMTVASQACSTPTEAVFEEWPEPTETYLSFTSDAGDHIGQGEARLYRLADAAWVATYRGTPDAQEIHISVSQPGEGWNLDFAAPEGQVLAVGPYEDAERFPFHSAGHPGLSFTGSGRGCNTLTGNFVIGYLSLGANNNIRRLHAKFEQHCDGRRSALRGEVAIVADP